MRIAAIVVGVVALAASAVATGGATLGIAASVLATAGTIASIATIASIGIGLVSLVASSKPRSSVTGSPADFKLDPQAPYPYMVGRSFNAGYVVHRDTYGTNNQFQSFVMVWSGGGPVEAIESFTVDTASIGFGTGGAAIGEFNGWMWLDTQLGACPESDALVATQGSFPGWGSASKLSGFAAGLWTLKFDSKGKHYQSGVPQPGAIIKGVKVYDPRADSTYPGGSGACRALNEATYVYSENPWLHALTFALGRFQNGKRVVGVGMPIGSIDVAAFVEAANIADANSWVIGGTVSTADDKWNVLKMMAQAGGGECMQLGAKLSCLVSTPRVSLATITYADVVGRASNTAVQARRDRINGVTPRIRSEAHGWEVVPLDVVRGDTYLTEDGAERTREIDYQLVQVADQAAHLAAYDIANSREIGPINLPLKPVWMGYKPGDCLTVDIPELGLTNQPCIDLNRELEPASGVVTLTLRSETTAKHAWALGQTGTAPPTPSLSAPDFSVAAPEEDVWTLAAISLEGTSGETVPILRVTGAAENTNAEAIAFEFRLVDTEDWHFAGLGAPDTTTFDIPGIIPGADYEVAVSYQVRGVKGDRRVLGPVTATALSVVGGDGASNASVFIYQRATSAPTLPSATTTYTFADGTLTGLNNGWTRTIPAGTNPLYVSLATASSTGTTDTIAAGEWASPVVLAQDGSGGLNSASVFVYQRNSTGLAPTVPSATATYTFATGGLTGLNNGWTAAVPAASGGTFLWVTTASAISTGATDTIPGSEWATPRVMAQDGSNGTSGSNGANTAAVYLYQRATSAPSLPAGTLTYTFATGGLAGTLGSWSQGVPATNGLPLWVTVATATGTGATDTIANTEWASPVTMTQDGANSASIFLYQRNSTGVAPSVPSVLTTYTFATAVLAGINNGWSQGVPDISNGTYLWVTTATALSTTATDTIAAAEWATAQVMAQNGAIGAAGANAAIVYLYQRASSSPSTPASTTTYTFASNALSGTFTPWSQTIPADNGLPLYVTTASATSNTATDTIAAGEWASPVVLTQTGTNGLNAATVYLFQRATSTPSVPASTITYTFATGLVSGTLGSWTQSIPAGTNPVYVTTATALGTGATDTIATGEWAAPNIIAQNGLDGTYAWTPGLTNISRTGNTFAPTASDGLNNGTFPCRGYSVEKGVGLGIGATAITPTTNNYVIGLDANPSAVANYVDIDFAVVPGSGNITVYTSGTSGGVVGTFTATDVLSVEHRGTTVVALKNGSIIFTWSGVSATTPLGAAFGFDSGGSMQVAVYKSGLDGAAGANGLNSATVSLYQRATSTPSVPSGTLTYTFVSGGLSGTLGSWTQSVPAGTDPLYVITAVASGTGSTDTVASSDWTAPQILAQNGTAGAAGLNNAVVYLYKRGTSSPAVPSTTLTYTFATGLLSGTLAGWTQTVPSGTDPIYVTTAPASSTTSTDTIANTEWASPTVIAQNGAQVVSAYRRGIVQPATPTGNSTPTGWSPTPLASAGDFVPITTTGMETNSDYSSFVRTSAGTADWSESFRSSTGGIGMAVGFRPNQTTKRLMIGLNTDPTTNNSYTSLDYAVHCSETGALEAWSNNALSASLGTYAAGDSLTVEHRDTTVVITKNGSVVKTWTGVSATSVFYVDSSFGDVGGKVTGVFATNGDLWISQAVQDLAGTTSGSWSTAIQFTASDAANGNQRDIKFKRSFAQPSTPTGDSPSGWSEGVPDGTETVWMTVALKSYGGALIGAWSEPQSLSGVTPRGSYNPTATYYLHNTVTDAGGTYIALQDDFSGHAPSGTGQANAYWDSFAPAGPPGTPAVAPSAFSASINLTSSTGTVNLRSIADANGYTGNSDATITFNVPSGVTIRGLPGSGVGVDSGAWPTSSYAISLTLVVQSGGVVDGGGGNGGAGGSAGSGAPGGNGGDAIFCRLPMTVTVNAGGTLRGGGGGGNGGDALGRLTGGEFLYKGGSGGGGGFPNGTGGAAGTGDISTGNPGSAGTTSGGGSGGAAVSGAGAGFNGGGAGTAAGFGGLAGYAVRKNGFTVTVSGSFTGTAG